MKKVIALLMFIWLVLALGLYLGEGLKDAAGTVPLAVPTEPR